MRTPEERVQFKNHFFKLGQGRLIAPDDERFWRVFYTAPDSAADVFDVLSATDVAQVRDQNLPNVLVLVEMLCLRIALFADLYELRAAKIAAFHKDARYVLNCVRLLTRVLPFLFELPSYTTEIEPRLFLAARFDPLALLPPRKPAPQPVIPAAAPLPPPAEPAHGSTFLATSLVFSLVRISAMSGFCVDSALAKYSSRHTLWEPGLGGAANYVAPDPVIDSNRAEILRLLLVLVLTSFYEKPSSVVSRGLVFLSILVAALPKQQATGFICSLTNLMCRTARPSKSDAGLEFASPVLLELRYACVAMALQLLAAMVVYAMPLGDQSKFLQQSGLISSERATNSARLFFSRLTKDVDLAFLASHLLAIVRAPLIPYEAANKTRLYKSYPLPLALSALVLLWELTQCNKLFRKLMVERFAVKLVPCALYHVFAFHDIPLHGHLVKVAAYFLLYLCSQPNFVKAFVATIPEKSMDSFPPEFRIVGSISTRDFLVIHTCQILTALIPVVGSKYHVEQDVRNFLIPTLVEILYNIIPCTNPLIAGTDSASKNMANINPEGGLSYRACSAVQQVLVLLSAPEFLTQAPGNAELLAFLLRALCAAASKAPRASRMVLFSMVENQTLYNNIWNSVYRLESWFFSSGLKLTNVDEDDLDVEPKTVSLNTSTESLTSPALRSPDQSLISSREARSPEPRNWDLEKLDEVAEDESTELAELRDLDSALRPRPPSGMSATAKEKLPRNTPLNKSWGGNAALRTILLVLIPAVRDSVKSFNKQTITGAEAYAIVKKIETSNIQAVIQERRSELHYDFLPDTPTHMLQFYWGHLSLGWYTSMLYWDIYNGKSILRSFVSADKTLMGNISSHLAMFSKIASSWLSRPSPDTKDDATIAYVEAALLQVNIWLGTTTKLFKTRQSSDRGNAFGIRFGSVGLTPSVNDITTLLAKRFSEFRSTRSSVSSTASAPIEELPERVKLIKRDSVSSLHSLNTLNRARSCTPRNSMSN